MKEELELVTSFESLRAGDLVVVSCACEKRHRVMLLAKLFGALAGEYPGQFPDQWMWRLKPTPHGESYSITEMSVERRRIYRVVIPPAAESREVARPKKLERAR
jgi:hypothetical protein